MKMKFDALIDRIIQKMPENYILYHIDLRYLLDY